MNLGYKIFNQRHHSLMVQDTIHYWMWPFPDLLYLIFYAFFHRHNFKMNFYYIKMYIHFNVQFWTYTVSFDVIVWYLEHLKYSLIIVLTPSLSLLSTLLFKKPSCYTHTNTHTRDLKVENQVEMGKQDCRYE